MKKIFIFVRNLKGNSMKYSLISIIIVCLITMSCSDNSTSYKNPLGNLNIYLGNDTSLTFADIVGNYDTTDVIGLITLKNEYEDFYLFQSSNPIFYDVNNARAYFFDPDDQATMRECAGIYVNNLQLHELHTGSKNYITSGDVDEGTGLVLNFGSGYNNIKIDSNQYIPSVDTNISFSSKIRITNLDRGDSVNKNNNITVNWSGNSTGYVGLSIITVVDSSLSNINIGHALLSNSGSFTLTSSVLDEFPDGPHDLILVRYEPKFITLSNGQKISVIGETTHKITIFFY